MDNSDQQASSSTQQPSFSTQQSADYVAVSLLNPSLQPCEIKCQVIRSGNVHCFGTGSLLKILLADEKLGHVYEIRNVRVKPINPSYVCPHSDCLYEIAISSATQVTPLPERLLMQTLLLRLYQPSKVTRTRKLILLQLSYKYLFPGTGDQKRAVFLEKLLLLMILVCIHFRLHFGIIMQQKRDQSFQTNIKKKEYCSYCCSKS